MSAWNESPQCPNCVSMPGLCSCETTTEGCIRTQSDTSTIPVLIGLDVFQAIVALAHEAKGLNQQEKITLVMANNAARCAIEHPTLLEQLQEDEKHQLYYALRVHYGDQPKDTSSLTDRLNESWPVVRCTCDPEEAWSFEGCEAIWHPNRTQPQ